MARGGKFVAWGIVAVFFVFAAAFVAVAADQQAPEKIVLKSNLWGADYWSATKYPPVEFSHKEHAEAYKIACTECHHKYEGGKNVWKQGDPVQKCEACHTEGTTEPAKIKDLPDDQKKLNLYTAFHDNCKKCHLQIKKDHPKAPTVCNQCHKK